MDNRAKLASQLVRCHALLWSVEDPTVKSTVRERIREIEARIAEFDRLGVMPAATAPQRVAGRLAR